MPNERSRIAPTWAGIIAGAVLVRAFGAMGASRAAPEPAAVADKPVVVDDKPLLGQPFTPGRGPTTAAWREEAITRANELEGLAEWIAATSDRPAASDPKLLIYVREHLAAVRSTAAGEDGKDGKPLSWFSKVVAAWRGAGHERALGNLDVVEATLLRMAPDSFVSGEVPSVQAHVNRFLPLSDPRRVRVSELSLKLVGDAPLTERERDAVVAAMHAANSQRRRDLLRVRSFRNVMFSATAALVPLVVALALFGLARPTAIPLCFNPVEKQKVVCPTAEVAFVSPAATTDRTQTAAAVQQRDLDDAIREAAKPGDILLIEIIGLIAAVVAGTAGLRNVRGTSTPYSLAVALALLKVPLGALTAVLGLILMSGGFVPGLSALDTSAQILAWALVFGFSQQLLTRLVDQRASSLLDNVGGRGATGERHSS